MPQTARLSRIVVTAAYAAQGLGYAVVVTTLPAFKARQQIDDTTVALIVLLLCFAAAGGSLLADVLAKWRGSRVALIVGLALEIVGLAAITVHTPLWLFIAAFFVYGVGLGAVDASSAMQGVLVQRAYGRDLMGGFFAGYTGAAIVGALLVAGVAAMSLDLAVAIAVVMLVAAITAVWGFFRFDPSRAATAPGVRAAAPLPRKGIWLFGFVILAAFTLDSGVSTWSTIYLHDELAAAAAIAPLGYAAYQIAILLTRLATDRVADRFGARRVVIATIVVSVLGCIAVAFVPLPVAAIIGFALAGVAVGTLVPLGFTSAGALLPARSDEIIARVNLFNYAGAVFGAVLLGLLAGAPGLGIAFLIPAAMILAVLPLARRFRSAAAVSAAPGAASDVSPGDARDR